MEISGPLLFPVIPGLSTLNRLHRRNGRANSARRLAGQTAETHADKFLRRVHTGARTGSLRAAARGPAAVRESDKAFPAPKSDQVLNARVRACRDSPGAQKVRRSAPARTLFLRTL